MNKNTNKKTNRGQGTRNCPKCGKFMSKTGHKCNVAKANVPKSLRSQVPSPTLKTSTDNKTSMAKANSAFSAITNKSGTKVRVSRKISRQKALRHATAKYQEAHNQLAEAIHNPSLRPAVESRYVMLKINWAK